MFAQRTSLWTEQNKITHNQRKGYCLQFAALRLTGDRKGRPYAYKLHIC